MANRSQTRRRAALDPHDPQAGRQAGKLLIGRTAGTRWWGWRRRSSPRAGDSLPSRRFADGSEGRSPRAAAAGGSTPVRTGPPDPPAAAAAAAAARRRRRRRWVQAFHGGEGGGGGGLALPHTRGRRGGRSRGRAGTCPATQSSGPAFENAGKSQSNQRVYAPRHNQAGRLSKTQGNLSQPRGLMLRDTIKRSGSRKRREISVNPEGFLITATVCHGGGTSRARR
jgi:hypothetical protein